MKRIISLVLLTAMVLSLLAGCGAPAPAADPTSAPAAAPTDAPAAPVAADDNLENAIAYLKAFYKTVRDGDLTPSDFERLGTVRVGLSAYEVVYTVDCDESVAKVVKGSNGMVIIDVNEESEVEVPYALTATVTGTDGKTASLTWKHVLPISMSGRGAEIVDAAYALEDGEVLPYEATLVGEIISVDTPYSPDYKNITVSIKITGREDKPIMCYRLKGEGCDALVPGDIITVTGTIKNYKGTIEFDAGCILEKVEKSANSLVIPTDPQEILEAAFALKAGESLPYQVTLSGKIVGVKTKYSEQYRNITVMIRTGEPWYNITCYRMKGEDVDKIWLDDEITVTGILKNYGGHTIEFDTGSIMESWIDNPDPKAPTDPAEIMKQAQALGDGDTLPYYCYLTGEVTSIRTKWNPVNGYVRLSISVGGGEVDCYRLRGEDIKDIAVGDTITVWGYLEKYYGAIQIYEAQLISPSDETLVDDLYELKDGESIDDALLSGTITSIDKAYSGSKISVTMAVDGKKTKPVKCVDMTGAGTNLLEVGDTIEVSGKLTNKAGSYQFASGCKLIAWTNANIPEVDNHSSQEEVLAAAKLLGTGQRLIGVCLEGTITQVNTPYNSRYGNVTVTINASGQSVRCNRLGDNKVVEKLGAGDTIKVYGKLWKNASGALEFQNDCGLVSYTLLDKSQVEKPATLKEQMEDAVANGQNSYESTVQGKIVGVPAYQSGYDNWNFNVLDAESGLVVYCYGLGKGEKLNQGDVVKVVGCLTSYGGNAQFSHNPGAKVTIIKAASDSGEELTGLAKDLYDASNLAEGEVLSRTSSMSGTVARVVKMSDYGKNQWDFYLSDGSNYVRCYFVDFKRDVEVKVGDKVSITGQLKMSKGEPQFTKSATITSNNCADYQAPVVEEPASGPLSIADAVALGKKFAHNTVSTNIYTVSGTISGTPNATYGNMTITDGSSSIYVYGITNWNDFAVKPGNGDYVVLTGVVGNYNGPQMKNVSMSFTPKACEHTNTTTTTVEATCTSEGSTTITCDDCGETVSTTPIGKLEHSFENAGETCDNCSEPNPNYVPEGGEGGVTPDPEGGEGGVTPDPEGGEGGVTPDPEGGEGGVTPDPEGGEGA